jgi:N-methylhydantoinase A
MSDLHADYQAVFYTSSDRFDFEGVNGIMDSLTAKCRAFRRGPGAGASEAVTTFHVEARYRDQIWEIDLPLRVGHFRTPEDVTRMQEDFDRLHEELFAFNDLGCDVEFVSWRATVSCRLREGDLGQLENKDQTYGGKVPISRNAYFDDTGMVDTRVALFERMEPNATVNGPAIIESAFTTVVIDPGAKAVRRSSGSLVIEP